MTEPERQELTEQEIVQLAESLEEKLEESKEHEAVSALTELSPEMAGEVLGRMDTDVSTELISHLETPDAAEILQEMPPDEAVDLMEELPQEEQAELLQQMDPREAKVLQDLASYPSDTAGGLMSPEVLALPQHLTVEQAIQFIRREADEKEIIYYTFVVDPERHLRGVLSMRDLILADPKTPVEKLAITNVVKVNASTDSEEVARLFAVHNFLALPVVDDEDRLLGIVTVDDVIDTIREEGTEDMHRLVGVSPEDKVLSPWHESFKRRHPWLLINLLTAFAAAAVVSLFQGTIAKFTALAVLMPIIAGQGGNAGSQTVTVVVRGMALGDLHLGEGRIVLFKELVLGILNGLVMGAIVAGAAYLWNGDPTLGIVVALAMLFNLIVAGMTGALIPLGLRFIGADPALASTIILTTFTDICGFFFLLGLGSIMLK